MSKYFLYNKSKNIKPIYDKEIDLSSIAEWIACGFFLGTRNFTKENIFRRLH